jgi:hypothetical protein
MGRRKDFTEGEKATIMKETAKGKTTKSMDHLHYRLNFDLDKNFITA